MHVCVSVFVVTCSVCVSENTEVRHFEMIQSDNVRGPNLYSVDHTFIYGETQSYHSNRNYSKAQSNKKTLCIFNSDTKHIRSRHGNTVGKYSLTDH